MANTGNRAPLTTAGAPTDAQTTELRMRRALGLTPTPTAQAPQQRPEQARQRHRFVQDGGVPVVVLNHKVDNETTGLRERITALEAQLEVERAAHETARRLLEEHRAHAQSWETRFVHAELAHKEALQHERALRLSAQEAAAAIPVRRIARTVAAQPAEAAPSADPVEPAAAEALPPRPKRGRPRSAIPKEPKPVRWWTPSYRSKPKV